MSDSFPDYCELTFRTEGGLLPIVLKAHWPGGVSGVTIGPGYDMGHRSETEVYNDLIAAGVPATSADVLKKGAGKTGGPAGTWTSANKDTIPAISNDSSRALFKHVYPKYVTSTKNVVTNDWAADWEALPQKMKEVLVDLQYRGDIKSRGHEKFLKPLVKANDYDGFKKFIQDYEYWQNNTNLPRLRSGGYNTRITERGKWLDGADSGPSLSWPLPIGGSNIIKKESIEAAYKHTEIEHDNGYFPLGANTVWHGGVHLFGAKGSKVKAMCEGKIVAARLPDDPAKAKGHFGNTGFVLLKHEISGAKLNKMAPAGKVIGYTVKTAKVNMRDQPTTKGGIVAVLEANDEVSVTNPTPVKADGFDWLAVTISKSKNAASAGKSGHIAIKPDWYMAKREPSKSNFDEKKNYVFYSLYMHLNDEKLDATSANLKEVKWLIASGAAGSAAIKGSVGEGGKNDPADVGAVQQRLKAQGFYAGEINNTADAATIAAIKAFQGTYSSKPDGRVDPGGKTLKELNKAPKPAPDAKLIADLKAGSVVKPDKPISAGDTLWTSGEYGPPGARQDMIHWEIFSEENLLPFFTEVKDGDEDFNIDSPEIVGILQKETKYFENDNQLTADEVKEFYSKHPKAKVLRQYACQFTSEWGINLDAVIPKMEEKQQNSTVGLKERLQPYMWWKDASSAVPSSPKVWHYNPVAFMEARLRA